MADIVDLDQFKAKSLEQRVFGAWKKRFGRAFAQDAGFSDISDKILFQLAQPGEQSAQAFYELIMGALNIGPALKFPALEKTRQLQVMDIHLFLADLARFEMMRRLGWIDPVACGSKSFVELVRNFDKYKDFCRETPPALSPAHPDYSSYRELHERDKEGFIRRLLPGALEIFKRKIEA